MKNIKRVLCVIVVIAMITALIPNTADAAVKVALNKKKVTLTITDRKANPSVTLKMKGVSTKTAKKAKWYSSDKTIATVKQGKVTAQKAGNATITCKIKSKKYTCKVTVIDSAALEVTIKDLGFHEASMNDPATTESIQIYGHNVMYLVNSQFVVTYNGKDVTDKAGFTTQCSPYVKTLNPMCGNGIMDINAVVELDAYKNPKLIVTYKGMERAIPLTYTTTEHWYYECYCGEIYNTSEEHTEHINSLDNYEIMKYHDGWYMIPYYVADVKVK